MPAPRKAGLLDQRKDGAAFVEVHVGRPHDREIHGIEPEVCDDARQDRGYPQLGLEEGGDKTGGGPGQHGHGQSQNRVAHQADRGGHGAAQRKGAVGGEIGDIQDGIAQKECQRHQGVDHPGL